jgi:hypothetical protein
MWQTQVVCSVTAPDKEQAKEDVARQAIAAIVKGGVPHLSAQCRIRVVRTTTSTGEVDDSAVTQNLLQFLQSHGTQADDEEKKPELQGLYNAIPGTILFMCRLVYRDVELGKARSDTRRRARQDAAKIAIDQIARALFILTPRDAETLVVKYSMY